MDIDVVSNFSLLWKILPLTSLHSSKCLLLHLFQVDLFLRMKCLAHTLCISSALANTEKWFFKIDTNTFSLRPSACKNSHYFHYLLFLIFSFSFQQLEQVAMSSWFQFASPRKVMRLSDLKIYSCVIWISSVEECLPKPLAHLTIGWPVLLPISRFFFINSIHELDRCMYCKYSLLLGLNFLLISLFC